MRPVHLAFSRRYVVQPRFYTCRVESDLSPEDMSGIFNEPAIARRAPVLINHDKQMLIARPTSAICTSAHCEDIANVAKKKVGKTKLTRCDTLGHRYVQLNNGFVIWIAVIQTAQTYQRVSPYCTQTPDAREYAANSTDVSGDNLRVMATPTATLEVYGFSMHYGSI